MFEARVAQGGLLKKLISSISDMVGESNWEANDTGISLQAMDTSHVALVSLLLRSDGFEPYRCDRNLTLGMNVNSLNKILKCAGNDDVITLSADDKASSIGLRFEGSKFPISTSSSQYDPRERTC